MAFIPLLDRIVIVPDSVEERTAQGIIITTSDNNKIPTSGVVISAGTGRYDNGVLIPTSLQVGDHVLWSKFVGSKLTIDGAQVLVMRESDIIGIIERKVEKDALENFAGKNGPREIDGNPIVIDREFD
jgi:chaperonin GroES